MHRRTDSKISVKNRNCNKYLMYRLSIVCGTREFVFKMQSASLLFPPVNGKMISLKLSIPNVIKWNEFIAWILFDDKIFFHFAGHTHPAAESSRSEWMNKSFRMRALKHSHRFSSDYLALLFCITLFGLSKVLPMDTHTLVCATGETNG